MSGPSQGGVTKAKAKVTPTIRAGLHFPVSKIYRSMKKAKYADRITDKASVYMASLLESVSGKVLEMMGNAAKDYDEKRITLRYVLLVVKSDEGLNRLFARILPSIQNPPFHTTMSPSSNGGTGSRSQD